MADYSSVDYSSDYRIAGQYDLFSSDVTSDKIYRHNLITSSIISDFAAFDRRGIAYDISTGNLLSCTTNTIYIHDGLTSGILSSFAAIGACSSMSYDPTTGNMLVLSTTNTLRVYDGVSSTVLQTLSVGPSTTIRPTVAIDNDGNLITANADNDRVYIHDGISGVTGITSSFASPSSSPSEIYVDITNGNLLSADNGTDLIYIHDGITSTVSSSFSSPSINPFALTLAYTVDYSRHGYESTRLKYDTLYTRHGYADIKLIQAPTRHGYTGIRLEYISDYSRHGYESARLTQSATRHGYTDIRLAKFSVYSRHGYTPPRLIQAPTRHGYASIMLWEGYTRHGYTATQFRAEGIRSYIFDLRDENDIQAKPEVEGFPPQTVFPDVFTGVNDGYYTIYIRSVQKYKNLENTIDETMIKFRLLSGTVQPLLPNLPLSVQAEAKKDAYATITWYYSETNQEIAPTDFQVYKDDVLQGSVTYTGASSYSVTLGPFAEASTVFSVSSRNGVNETPDIDANTITPDSTPPETVPFTFEVL